MRRSITLLTGLIACLFVSAQNNGRLLDWPMKLNSVSIQVRADAFTATTFIEMEFCNPNDKEIEGLYRFELEPGQAITSFQLELNGKFRDGSIEEKWKARNAYNTTVGKRVDPALLQMEYYNHYSLNVYPIAAKSCRRVRMTIQQMLKPVGGVLLYKLPVYSNDTLKQITVNIKAGGCSAAPSVVKGLLSNQAFSGDNGIYQLSWSASAVKMDKPLSFSIPLSLEKPALCIKQVKEKSFFALRFIPHVQRQYSFRPDKIKVFWDISAGGRMRDTEKEIEFLKQYISAYNISQLTIVTFNQKARDTAVFFLNNNHNRWRGYLQALTYEGATQYGSLDFSGTEPDAILLFSDGKNSFGKSVPVPGKIHVYCLSSANDADSVHLDKIIGYTGGKFINLAARDIKEAVNMAGVTENVLMRVKAGSTEVLLNEKISALKADTILLSGIVPAGTHSLTLQYGNNGEAREEEKIDMPAGGLCDESAIDRLEMLNVFDNMIRYGSYWYEVLNFGKTEKVVTTSTSYIVLERIEDYIKFNIMPPPELQPECDMNIFVKADEERRKQFKQMNEFDILKSVVSAYNERIGRADKNGASIVLKEEDDDKQAVAASNNDPKIPAATVQVSNGLTGKTSGLLVNGSENAQTMSEVVVTAMGQRSRPKSLGYTVSVVRSNELTQAKAVNLQNGLTGKVSGLNVQQVNNGVFGDTRITLRGIRSLTGNNQPMLVLDGAPISISYLNSINPNDINDVTVLKSASSTAIYGPDGVNGALLVNTKKGSRSNYGYYWSSYRLKDRPDVDYLKELKHTSSKNLLVRYDELRREYGGEAAFYFDVAQVFYESGSKEQALDMLYTAMDVSNGSQQTIEAAAFVMETWKEFGEAINVYSSLLAENAADLSLYRSLALAYYQNRNYTKAINVYYSGILNSQGNYEYAASNFKAMMMQEMNAVIAAHKDSVDVSSINKQLIHPLNYDLRITLNSNLRNLGGNVSIVEPGGKKCSYYGPQNAEGRLSGGYYYYSDNYYNGMEEYQLKQAKPGKYKVRLSYNGYYNLTVPSVVRVVTFRNTAKGAVLEVGNAMMDNQYGDIEIAEVKW